MNFKNYTANSNAAAKATTTKNDQVNTVAVEETEKSIVDLSYSHKTTFDAGKLVPIYYSECYPGDHFNIDVSALIKMSIPSAPTMDAPRYDINFFFVPWKQVYPNWNNVIGTEYSGGAPVEEATVPAIQYDTISSSTPPILQANDLGDYFNIPVGVNLANAGISINALPFRAYVKIWDEWYRDENLQAEADYSNDNNINDNVSFNNENFTIGGNTDPNNVQYGGGLLSVNRLRDYFASCLPFIQKGAIPTIATVSSAALNEMLANVNGNNLAIDTSTATTDANGIHVAYYNSNGLQTNTNIGEVFTGTQSEDEPYLYQNWTATIGNNDLNLNSSYANSAGLGTFNITDLRNALVK